MSDILTNAQRYDSSNTERVDMIGLNYGQPVADRPGVIGFDCSGYFFHVMRESGYPVEHVWVDAYRQSPMFESVALADVEPGDAVFFQGHMGFVVEYNPLTGLGKFRHMSGSNNVGEIKDSDFSTNGNGYWGGTKPFVSIRRVVQSTYDPSLDNHADGSTSPVLRQFPKTPSTGVAPTGIPNAPSDPLNYSVHVGDTWEARAFENGVIYMRDTQTAKQYWSVPIGVGSKLDITQFPDGQVTSVQYNADPTTGGYLLDSSSANIQQYLQQQTLTLPLSGLSAQEQQAWQNGYQALSDVLSSDPNASVSVAADSTITVTAGNNTYGLTAGAAYQYTTNASGQPVGINILSGPGAGQTFLYSFDNNLVVTDSQAATTINQMVNSLKDTGSPFGKTETLVPENYDGIVHATIVQTGTITPIADITIQAVSTGGVQTGIITTNFNYTTQTYTQTVDTRINGDAVNVTYTYDPVTGEPVPHVNSINGQPPIDQAATDAVLRQSGVGPGELVYGNAGVAGTNVAGRSEEHTSEL